MNRIYGFEGEVKAKYSTQTFQLFTEVFHCLPLCYCLGGKIIVLHGGLFSRDDVTLGSPSPSPPTRANRAWLAHSRSDSAVEPLPERSHKIGLSPKSHCDLAYCHR